MVISRSPLLLQMVLVASLACGSGDDLVVSAKTSQALMVTRDGDDALSFGASIARVGDLNDDGFQDVVIGAPSEGDGAGQAYLLLGDEHPVANAELLPFDEEHAGGDGFGVAVTGLSEDSCEGPIASLIAVGTVAFDPDGTTSSTGEIELYRAQVESGQVDIAYTGSVVGEELVSLGDVVPVAADVFGEGVQALLVGNSTYRDPADEVYESGVVLAYSIDYQTASASDPEAVYGEATKDSLGRSLVPVGDLDGDGNVDLAAGTSTGKVYLIFGNSEGGLDAIPFTLVDLDTTDQVQTAAVKLTPPENADSGSGDEGGRLLVLSRSGCDDQVALTGQEYLVEVDSNREVSVDTTAPPISVADNTSCNEFHISASAGADLDLDGESDVVVGAAGSDTMGGAKLLFGANGTPFEGGLGTGGGVDELGWAVAMVGDVNGDNFPDAAIGAPGTSEELGAVYFFYGGNDIDGDGFARVRADATSSDDASDDALDCDDLDSSAYPDADVDESDEVKDGVDRNCDGTIGAPDGCGCHATPDTRSGDRRGDGGGLRLALSAGIGAAVLARRRRPARGV